MATPIPRNYADLTAWSAAAATDGTIVRIEGDGPLAVGVTSDSRGVEPRNAFIALRGGAHDGHDYLQAAADAGATLLVLARGHGRALPEGPAVVEVEDTLDAWGKLAGAHLRAWRRIPRSEPARVVGITGSAGKTTTKELCAALLGAVAPTLATPGNLNNRVGLPAVAFGLEYKHRFAVLEMGMSVRGEIEALGRIARPDVSVLLNVGLAHAEGVGGSRGAVAREKGAILESLETSGTAIVNADDPAALGQLVRTRASSVQTFGRASDATYRLADRESLGEHGSRVLILRPARVPPLEVILPLVGEAAAIDFVAAIAAVEAASGWTLTAGIVREALASFQMPEGRAAIRMLAQEIVVLDDTYNANPASMRAALSTLADLARARGTKIRTVAILGEMKELGPTEVAEHDALGELLVDTKIDLAIGCGGLASRAIQRAADAGIEAVDAPDLATATSEALSRVRPGDVVLVKGSRSVGAEAIVAALTAAHAPPAPETPSDAGTELDL